MSACNANQYVVYSPAQCLDCDASCSTCDGSLSTNCLSCGGSLFLDASTNSCVSSCPSNTFINSSAQECSVCHSTCTTCSGASNTECLTCTLPYYYKSSTSECVIASDCDSNSYADSAAAKCKNCDSTCATCSGSLPTNCYSCTGSLQFQSSTHTCISSCPDGYSDYLSSGSCLKCNSTCKTCSGADYNQVNHSSNLFISF